MNTACLLGRLTADPELIETSRGDCYTRFTLAINRRRDDDGADFIRCVAFGKTAEIICKYVVKGQQIGVVGRIQTGSYKDKDGRTVYTVDVIVDSFDFCGAAGAGQNQSERPAEPRDDRRTAPAQSQRPAQRDRRDTDRDQQPSERTQRRRDAERRMDQRRQRREEYDGFEDLPEDYPDLPFK